MKRSLLHIGIASRRALIALFPLHLLLTGVSDCEGEDPDADGDGYSEQDGDCDDTDASSFPGAPETCDGIDNSCDGEIDEGLSTLWYRDADGDGYGTVEDAVSACAQPGGYVASGGDCDDSDAAVHPGAPEVCDDLDNSCDGEVDEGLSTPWYRDQDGDGYGMDEVSSVACAQPDGYVAEGGDCNDTDSAISPAASELCDGIDNDCDAIVDDGVNQGYLDRDGDGFGAAPTCDETEDTVARAGDCDDFDDQVYPGAEDLSGDEIDADCGGSDLPQPSVGLASSTYTLLQDALDAAATGEVVWVGPGTYHEHDLTFRGKAIRLSSTDGATSTTVDADDLGAVLVFNNGEGADSVVQGFSLTDGKQGVRVIGASPTLEGLLIRYNGSAGHGGGLYLEDAGPTLIRCTISNNYLDGYDGAGLYLLRSSPVLDHCQISTNNIYTPLEVDQNCDPDWGCYYYNTWISRIGHGAGMYLDASSATLKHCTLSANRAWKSDYAYEYYSSDDYCQASGEASGTDGGDGGAIYGTGSNLELIGCRLEDNSATNGGAVFLKGSSASMRHCRLARNRADVSWTQEQGETTCIMGQCTYKEDYLRYADGTGGGIMAYDSSVELKHVVMDGNSASLGGAVNSARSASTSELTLNQSVVVRNSVTESTDGYDNYEGSCQYPYKSGATQGSLAYGGKGGGVYSSQNSTTRVLSSILAYNTGWNLYSASQTADITWSDLYSDGDDSNHNLSSLDASNTLEEPGFLAYDADGLPADMHLATDSPLVDAGDPSSVDADGSPSDLGAYGGAAGDGWDLDGDGYHDYYWPGTIDDAPEGIDPADYDADDLDQAVH